MSVTNINPVVVIPIYKELANWTPSEFLSVRRCIEVLSRHPIYLIGPEKLNWNSVLNWINKEFSKIVLIETFENNYFNSIDGYNKLLKSIIFYKCFNSYSHILVYQPDSYVFRDELLNWCRKGYDYIGAPWLEGFTDNSSTKFVGVGNGGFSLHKTSSAIKTLKKIKTILSILEICEKTYLYKKISYFKWTTRYVLLKHIFKIKNQKYIYGLSLKDKIYEDKFWGIFIPATFNDFKVANISESIRFSFEVNPRFLYELNNKKLPFGCHAWERYDPDFWMPFIKDRHFVNINLNNRNEN